jgi:hypothetical protein
VNELLGGGPWGLCDIAVVEPPKMTQVPVLKEVPSENPQIVRVEGISR